MDTITNEETFRLADLLANLSDELSEAQRRAANGGKEHVFRLKGCTVELGVSWERNSEGAVEFSVVKLGEGVSRFDTESIIISLEAAAAGGSKIQVTGVDKTKTNDSDVIVRGAQ